jgi:hypothetical protein
VRLNWKFLWLAMLVAFALPLSGCGGVNVGGSVSPATFFLPGVKNNVPAPAVTGAPLVASKPSQQFAQAR